ncbi:RNA polymerase II degradation factor 1-like [Chenopodium quinoa]|uniref:RNA polymerase II degradation factor 1-like n=1 Tax=Chenopodium quinoa TaxID=63459 RepID=UPI000B78DA19|nr:RNA polymerase II degradation factor 1-like [Chenopodium quinoa]
MKTPLRKKQEEVRDAQKRAAKLLDVCQYNSIMLEVKTKAREMKQEELIRELTNAADNANKAAEDCKVEMDQLKADINNLKEADKERAGLKDEVTRLGNDLEQAKGEYKYATEVFDAQVLRLPQPAPFDEWDSLEEEQAAKTVPGEAREAQTLETHGTPAAGQDQPSEQQQPEQQQQQQQQP